MRHRLPFVLAASLVSVSATSVRAEEPPSIAVLELKPAAPDDAKLAAVLSDAIAVGVGKAHKGRVVSQREVSARIDTAAQQQLMGCNDDKCLLDVSKALAVDQIIAGRVGVVNGQALVFLSLLSLRDGGVIARASSSLAAHDKQIAARMEQAASSVVSPTATPLVAMEQLAGSLFSDEAARAADVKLTDLRVAVLFDEVKSEGGEMPGHPVEACVQKQLVAAGADVVSPAIVAQLKGRAGPRTLLSGGVPDTIDANDVDVILAGVVEYETSRNETLGILASSSALTLQLMKIDTGDVIASESPRGHGSGHGALDAQRAAADDVCAAVKPALQQALGARVARGERVVVDVKGVTSPAAADALVALLRTQPLVARAKLKRLQGDRAIIDVVVKGGDGLALGLALARVDGAPIIGTLGPAAVQARARPAAR